MVLVYVWIYERDLWRMLVIIRKWWIHYFLITCSLNVYRFIDLEGGQESCVDSSHNLTIQQFVNYYHKKKEASVFAPVTVKGRKQQEK